MNPLIEDFFFASTLKIAPLRESEDDIQDFIIRRGAVRQYGIEQKWVYLA